MPRPSQMIVFMQTKKFLRSLNRTENVYTHLHVIARIKKKYFFAFT